MIEQIFSPQVIGLLIAALSIVAGVSVCAYLLERKTKKERKQGKGTQKFSARARTTRVRAG